MYQYSNDNITFYVQRVNGEIFFYVEENGIKKEVKAPLDKDYPLYNLPSIESGSETIFFCEDEEKANRLIENGYTATAFCSEKTDFKPLKKRKIIVMPSANAEFQVERLKSITEKVAPFPEEGFEDIPSEELKQYVESNRPDRLPRVSIEIFQQREFKKRKIILSPFLREGSITMIAAPAGLGKTWVALGIAHAVASLSDFLLWKGRERRRVAYFDYELGAYDLQQRNALYLKKGFYIPNNYLFYINRESLLSSGRQMPELSNPWDRDVIYNTVEDCGLIIFDTLSRASMEDEMRVDKWKPIEKFLLNLCAEGKAVILVHHTNMSGSKQRGTTAHEDSLETSILLTRLEEGLSQEEAVGAAFEVSYPKTRAFYGEDAEPFIAKLVTRNIGGEIQSEWECVSKKEERITVDNKKEALKEQIRTLMKEGNSANQICAELQIRRKRALALCREIKTEINVVKINKK